jgi:hypothetical protein
MISIEYLVLYHENLALLLIYIVLKSYICLSRPTDLL